MSCLTAAAIIASLPTPVSAASATVVRTQVVNSNTQHMKVSRASAIETVERSDYAVSYYSVVVRPVAAGTVISSPFGHRAAPCATCSTYHAGVDYLAHVHTAIAAIADGTVTEVGNPSGNRGVYVILKHSINGTIWYSAYSHMEIGSMTLAVGDTVRAGQTVGRVGSTGQSTGAHLFFQIMNANQTPINPVPWLESHITG